MWVIGHECGHSAFSSHKWVCDVIGFVTHTFFWTPYFSWRISHHRHHSNHASMEKDEVYVPKSRSDLGLPQEKHSVKIDYDELLGDTPIYTLLVLLRQQMLDSLRTSCSMYLGRRRIQSEQIILIRNAVYMSNTGIFAMIIGVVVSSNIWGFGEVVKYYYIPWLCVSNWFIMITYRGAACTVDRDFPGWQGRFFLHDVTHFHIVHHFFPQMPFYHGPEATEYLKAFIGEHYAYSNAPVFKQLWETYKFCQFVEDDGDVVFYRNEHGKTVRRLAGDYTPQNKEA
ncbi:hypothetical protein FRB94_002702 [Tulasnella sp. JGI-2019a]|nr:hypothetical protein FRB93_008904 [Tulasnella sp. JGI-2019a]KAG9004053.1 hypothetical protein FRB94_002702 [Tulasnella sp. JGI-2019a]